MRNVFLSKYEIPGTIAVPGMILDLNHPDLLQVKTGLGNDDIGDHSYVRLLQAAFRRRNRNGDAGL